MGRSRVKSQGSVFAIFISASTNLACADTRGLAALVH